MEEAGGKSQSGARIGTVSIGKIWVLLRRCGRHVVMYAYVSFVFQYNGSSTTPAAERASHIFRPADDGMSASRSRLRTARM